MQRGDLLFRQTEDQMWHVVKILEIDEFSNADDTFHCLIFEPHKGKPTPETIDTLKIQIRHAPIANTEFKKNWKILCSSVLTEENLQGFYFYLKITDFARYIEVTKQDLNEVIAIANNHYKKAHALDEEKKLYESIEEYSKAIDIFPLFYEAIDNRAFTYMELGDYAKALTDFKTSLEINPEGSRAFFSKGECLLQIGDDEAAAKIFQEGIHKFPEGQATYLKFLEIAQSSMTVKKLEQEKKYADSQKKWSKKKPWWKFSWLKF